MNDEIIVLDDYRPHEWAKETCADCGHTSLSVHPVGTPWPMECSQCGEMSCVPACAFCGCPESVFPFAAQISFLFMGESWTELGCLCEIEAVLL